ncbi:transcription factor MYB106-like [Hibiscus syriacus]|uniref:transcription factor MYB106-like n=1 Tax=Hibiscus syriacus TaxID=106335 RepID=UPI00192244DC|nr:transcription factor MYB106-like [Hibiscus syriacus]
MGIDPTTHKPKSNPLIGSTTTGSLNHMAQWESARLEAEARLVKDSKKIPSSSHQKSSNNDKGSGPSTDKPACIDVLKAWQSVVTGMFAISTTNNYLNPVVFESNQSSASYELCPAEAGSITGIG